MLKELSSNDEYVHISANSIFLPQEHILCQNEMIWKVSTT